MKHIIFILEIPSRIDFLTKAGGLIFNDAMKLQVYFKIDSYNIPVLHVEHLYYQKC